MATMIKCPYCDKLTDPKLDSCVHCGGFLRKPSARPAQRAGAPAGSQTCPSCGALVREGDIICVACGTNLLTGQKIAQEQRLARTPGYQIPWGRIGIAAAVLLVVAAALYFFLTRDPVARAHRLAVNDRRTEAIELLKTYIVKKPEDPRAHAELGKLYWDTNDFGLAAQELEKASQETPDDLDTGMLAVIALQRQPNERTRERQRKILEALVKAHPDNTDALYLLGLARGDAKDYAGLLSALTEVANKSVGNNDRRLALGVAMALQNDVTGASQELQAVQAQDTANPDALGALGLLETTGSKTDAAVEKLKAAASSDSTIRRQYAAQAGLLLMAQGKYSEAQGFLSKAVDAGDESPSTNFFFAVCEEQQRMYEPALNEFEALTKKPGPFAVRAAVHAARIYISQGNGDKAVASLNAITIRPTGTEAAELETVRGRAQILLNDVTSADESFHKAFDADASYAPAHLENGLMQVQRRNMPEGVRELERYLKLVNADDPDAGVREVQALVDQLRQSAQPLPGAPSTAAQPRGDTT